MKTILRNLSLMLAILISLCSCFDIWVNPISDVKDAKIDERLIGTWLRKNESDDETMIHIHEIDQHSVYLYSVTPKSICDPNYVEAHVSEVDGRTFLNWRTFDCSTKEFSRYWIIEYEFNGENEMTFYLTDYDFVREAIRNKRLSGKVINGDTIDVVGTIVVTATSLEIKEFIKNSPKEELFYRDDPPIFKRFERPKDTKRSTCILF